MSRKAEAARQPQPALARAQRAAQRHALDAALAEERETLQALFPLESLQRPARKPRRVAPVLGLLLAAAAAAAAWWADPAYRSEHLASAIGARERYLLGDGSEITLDSDTVADVSWHLRSRRVALLQGRARFAVTPAVVRPFEVDAGLAQVRVVGTRFDVSRTDSEVQVQVLEGRVQLRGSAGQPWNAAPPLAPGQARRIRAGEAPGPVRQVDIARAGAWAEGRLVFESTPLSEALAEVQRYRRGAIRLQGDKAGQLRLSGVFDTARPDDMLRALPHILPVELRWAADGGAELRAR
ncbi:hypothetical protein GT347_21405 [Xylophilus rhododendri]|uniref:FecR protein domain-containing protein n=1 Tax=Xylophilus rhododendri TaxID=2697032 RepID=A0A857JC31_9BURK|nr:FecR domain-containing protein [Xylophilus rhododendri]QHJ00309.1 hypothetical protein GT347_21405 [Xylophilus rhododendri]